MSRFLRASLILLLPVNALADEAGMAFTAAREPTETFGSVEGVILFGVAALALVVTILFLLIASRVDRHCESGLVEIESMIDKGEANP